MLTGLLTVRADWSAMTISTVGYGDVVPENDAERVYVILVRASASCCRPSGCQGCGVLGGGVSGLFLGALGLEDLGVLALCFRALGITGEVVRCKLPTSSPSLSAMRIAVLTFDP